MTDLVKASRQHVQQEALDELLGRHLRGAISARADDHLRRRNVEDTCVGYGDAMSIPREILEDLLRTSERFLRVNDPLDAVQRVDEPVKGARLSQLARAADKLNFARFHGGIESTKQCAAEQVADEGNRKQKSRLRWEPSSATLVETTGGDDLSAKWKLCR